MCGGQSNMELTVAQAFNASVEIQRGADFPLIRLFTVGGEYTDSAREYKQLRSVWQDWSVASPQALGAGNWTVFSAACWYFGRSLQQKLGVPVGLVSNNWGGTSIQPWMSPDAIKQCPVPAAATTAASETSRAGRGKWWHPMVGNRPMVRHLCATSHNIPACLPTIGFYKVGLI